MSLTEIDPSYSINSVEYDLARGLFQRTTDMSEESVDLYASMLLQAASVRGVPMADLFNLTSERQIGLTDTGLTALNYLRPVNSKLGIRTKNYKELDFFIAHNIRP